MGHKKAAAQINLSVPAVQTHRGHLIVFSVVDGKKCAAIYRGVLLPSYRVLEHAFELSGWDGITAWAQELIDDIWDWYIERVDNERSVHYRGEDE